MRFFRLRAKPLKTVSKQTGLTNDLKNTKREFVFTFGMEKGEKGVFCNLCLHGLLLVLSLLFVLPVYSEPFGAEEIEDNQVLPPSLLESHPPVYPDVPVEEDAEDIKVVLLVEVSDTGVVTKITVYSSGGEAFDNAAVEAVENWRFQPAMKGESFVTSRILVPIIFSTDDSALDFVQESEIADDLLKEQETVNQKEDLHHDSSAEEMRDIESTEITEDSEKAEKEAEKETDEDEKWKDWSDFEKFDESEEFLEVLVEGERRELSTSTSEFLIELGNLRVIPRRSAAEQLMLAPGVLTTNHGGEGHAHETFMRGFASKEGQDIEYLVDGVPVNDISNPHNHGYADIHFIPDELVQSVRITEGPFDPSQGDFSFIGTAHYRLGPHERGTNISYGQGSFNRQRLFLSYAPPESHQDTFAAFEIYRSSGYGSNRSARRSLALGRYSGVLPGSGMTWRLSAYGYAARFDQAGVIRQDDYLAGRIGFFDTYDTNQGGESNRLLLSFDTTSGEADRRIRQTSWIGLRSMRLRANFTGWLTDVTVTPEGRPNTQRGDGLEQIYNNLTMGSRGSYDLSAMRWNNRQTLSTGYAFRMDQGQSSQYRLRSVTAIPYSRVFDDQFQVLNLSGWMRTQLRPTSRLSLRGGFRIDTFSFGIVDLNLPTGDREGYREPIQTRQSFGYSINPRITMDYRIFQDIHLVASHGIGTRSSDASALSDNETAPFARARVTEGGMVHDFKAEKIPMELKTQMAYVHTKVDKDMLFDPVAGRNIFYSSEGSSIPVGPSTRHAVLFTARLLYSDWFDAILNTGWAQGTLDSTGELIPYVPQLVSRIDTGISGNIFNWRPGNKPLSYRAGLSFTYVPGRPLPYQSWGDDYYLFNLAGELRFRYASLSLELQNLLNLQYRETEYNYPSNFRSPDALSSQRPVRHFTAGEPRSVFINLTIHLEEMMGG